MDIWKEKNLVVVKFPYQADVVDALREIGGGRWDAIRCVWTFPMKKFSVLKALQSEVNGDRIGMRSVKSLHSDGYYQNENSDSYLRAYRTIDSGDDDIPNMNKAHHMNNKISRNDNRVSEDHFTEQQKMKNRGGNGYAEKSLSKRGHAYHPNREMDKDTTLEIRIVKSLTQMRRYMMQAGYSRQTIKNYVTNVDRFLAFSKGQMNVTLVNTYMIELLENRKCSHAYCNQAINALKLFAKQQGLLSDGYLELVRPKREFKLPKVLSKEEVKAIIDVTENIKHQTVLMLGYSCGMRVSEVANLKVSDIHRERGIITIRQSKGRKDRIVPLSKKMAVQLERYEEKYHPYEWLFENQNRSGGITSRTLQTVFNDAKEKAGITHEATFHSLRHSFATHLLDTGVDIRIIQELLGHASSKTTEIYTHVTTQTIQKIANPLDDL
ncbi:tyrosine-type recombinase/integrase [Fusibacter paucivorans]|uniref:Tyrosine-type recombinase/integrase n=1 Tax=Fusibacter paucivorans TaxID=76009 RepID=A0ABS5PRD2_9FIRM|nr:tyrosine-type recombinase/integrase [Fusibacter paucivorans]MBS7527628.1 tyrosine-type recombinase/integrase [Fusibacter paucivorans]